MTINLLTQEYSESKNTYDRYTNKLKSLINDLLSDNTISIHLLTSRTKTIESVKEKLIRKQEKYNNLNEITDLSALRVIVNYPKDIKKVEEIINKEFSIDINNSKTSGKELSPNEFGYLSSHIVFSLDNNRSNLSEWKPYKSFKCEIQIRTVLQHAWASISHSFQYKSKSDIPKNLQRKLFRLAGLFELADEQFDQIKDIHENIKTQIKSEPIDKSKRELNLLSVSNFIEKSDSVKSIYQIALMSGYSDESDEPELMEQNSNVRWVSNLIKFCNISGIDDIKSLDSFCKNQNLKELEFFFNDQHIDSREWYVSPVFILILVLIYNFQEKINIEILVENGWAEEVAEKILIQAKKTKNYT